MAAGVVGYGMDIQGYTQLDNKEIDNTGVMSILRQQMLFFQKRQTENVETAVFYWYPELKDLNKSLVGSMLRDVIVTIDVHSNNIIMNRNLKEYAIIMLTPSYPGADSVQEKTDKVIRVMREWYPDYTLIDPYTGVDR